MLFIYVCVRCLLDLRDNSTNFIPNSLGGTSEPNRATASPAASQPARRRRKRCERKQKRGRRGGSRARLAASPYKPAILSLILVYVRLLDNKMDHKPLLGSAQRDARDCCVFILPETWLNDNIPDSGIQLPRLTCYRVSAEGGKTRGGEFGFPPATLGAGTLLLFLNTAHHWWSLLS